MLVKKTVAGLTWKMTHCVVWLGGVLALSGGCSPAKVEMNRVQRLNPPPVIVIQGASTPIEYASTPDPVFLRGAVAVENAAFLQQWQTWSTPALTSMAKSYHLTQSERLGWGSAVDSSVQGSGVRVVLEARLGGQRCVFRNRMIKNSSKDVQALALQLPAPMGNQDLLCVDRDALRKADASGTEHGMPRMTISVDKTAVQGGLSWVGTTAIKAVPTQAGTQVDLKVSQIIAQKQAFGRALRELLPDGMDHLLNVEQVDPAKAQSIQNQAAACGLSRSAIVNLKMDGERVVGARAFVHTRLLSARTQSQTRWILTQAQAALPQFDADAAEDCQAVRGAWTVCLKDGRNCSAPVRKLLDANFGDLLQARVPGFVSQSVFALTRREANGVGPEGAKTLAVWADLGQTMPQADAPNPLSVEDFQEFVDVVDLDVVDASVSRL